MKKIVLLLLCATAGLYAQADKLKFSAKVENRNSDTLTIQSRTFKKVMVGKNGAFADAFDIPTGFYQLFDGAEVATVYLKNGYDLTMSLNAKMFDESISYTGKGSKENNIIARQFMDNEVLESSLAKAADEAAVVKLVNETTQKWEASLADKELDENFRTQMTAKITAEKPQMAGMAIQAFKAAKMVGKPAPAFNYENAKGGTTKLADLKGKYVYIDVWATWCGPCRQEIPFLQRVEEKYKGKNIAFISISVDVAKDHEKWAKMVTEKALGGIQLFADKDWKSDFIQAFGINSIPRFILIDPKGNVVEADAKRPSDPALQEQLDKLVK